MDAFWKVIGDQLEELKSATTADDVLRVLAHARDPYVTVEGQTEGHGPGRSSDSGFFGGSGGDGTVEDSLHAAGWRYVWREAHYYWCMVAPNGDLISYVEGDIFRGDSRP